MIIYLLIKINKDINLLFYLSLFIICRVNKIYFKYCWGVNLFMLKIFKQPKSFYTIFMLEIWEALWLSSFSRYFRYLLTAWQQEVFT